MKPLYSIPKAGNHWFKTYYSHYINEISIKQSTYDPYLLYNTNPFGIIGLQTNDTLFVATIEFVGLEQTQLQKAQFLAKEREKLTTTTTLKFNSGLIQLDSNRITLIQEYQYKNLKPVRKEATSTTSNRGTTRTNLTTREQYIAQRARGVYITTVY